MLDPHWVFLGAALGVLGGIRYAAATARGQTRPNLVTWTLWAAAPLIGFLAQLDSGVGLPAVTTLAAGLGPALVVATALCTGHHHARLGSLDLACAATAATALGVWLVLGRAPSAVLYAVAADAVAALPTITKAWREPNSENLLFYALVAVGATITLATITSPQPHAWAFAAYQLTICAGLVGIVGARRRHARLGTG